MALVMLLMMAGFSSPLSATRPVSYVHKLLDLEGCQMSFSVTQLDTIYYIVVCAESDRLRFIDEPKMKMVKNSLWVSLTQKSSRNQMLSIIPKRRWLES